ncbi:MAG: SDR family NAD(P)-dependent oxidoreductase [Ruminococcaceae bacterium]|nr:SDR family NAD(P)-dependent oxidoreductase [Oscillospiraceae bacterium]
MVVGGSNGLGAATVKKLLSQNYEKVYIVDMSEPSITSENTDFIRFNLINDNPQILAQFDNVNTLIVTAGVGRLDYFQNLTNNEIETSFQINAVSLIKTIKAFYNKINSNNDFYCAVISSIAGLVSSPLYSVYSASKAAVSKFVEALNAELEGQNVKNRILSVCPGFIDGTKFHGGDSTNFDLVMPLVDEIFEKMINRETQFIPNPEVYQNVLERYHQNPQKFGLESYNYKLEKNNIESKPKTKIGYLTGSFDLFHIGHLNLLRRAKQYCDYLIVGVHTDGSHKGKELFIPLDQRMEIIKGIKYVDEVVECSQSDLDAYDDIKYDFLFVGSDYKGTERFNHYEEVLNPLGVKIIYFPYTTATNSTQIREKITKNKK